MRDKYRAEFIGDIKIKNLIPEGYTVEFYLDNSYYPLSISADLPDDEFIEYIKQELLNRNLIKTKYFKAVRISHNNFCK